MCIRDRIIIGLFYTVFSFYIQNEICYKNKMHSSDDQRGDVPFHNNIRSFVGVFTGEFFLFHVCMLQS